MSTYSELYILYQKLRICTTVSTKDVARHPVCDCMSLSSVKHPTLGSYIARCPLNRITHTLVKISLESRMVNIDSSGCTKGHNVIAYIQSVGWFNLLTYNSKC